MALAAAGADPDLWRIAMEPRLRMTIADVERLPVRLILQALAMVDALAWLDGQAELDAASNAAVRDAERRLRGGR